MAVSLTLLACLFAQVEVEGICAALEGRFKLIRCLVQVLEMQRVGVKREQGLIHLLLTRYLFPEAQLHSCWSQHPPQISQQWMEVWLGGQPAANKTTDNGATTATFAGTVLP